MSENGLKEKLEEIMKSFEEPFVSEADFQFSLSNKLQEELKDELCKPNSGIMLEFPTKIKYNEKDEDKDVSIDICVKIEGIRYFIELKYKTKKDVSNRFGEKIELKDQAAHDLGRYGFIKDIKKMEVIREKYKNSINYCIFLTNDVNYEKKQENTLDENFSLHKKIPKENLCWNETCICINREEGKVHWTTKYENIETLQNSYVCNWEELEKMKTEKGTLFRYLLITIPPERKIDK